MRSPEKEDQILEVDTLTPLFLQGYEYPNDERVLEGSCGLEYSLKRVGGTRIESPFRRNTLVACSSPT